MTVNKRKKSIRLRGGNSHGYGSKKKHRGSGSRGGKGMAGSGKRSDSKKPSIWKYKYFGKHGFSSKKVRIVKPINIDFLDENIHLFASKDLTTKENKGISIDLDKLGYNRLLGNGRVANKFKIRVNCASKKAIEKIKDSGGEVILIKKSKEE